MKYTCVPKTNRGFTIVELLIVIVVIGILAAITIVAFNGVQERARASATSSALAQASKKIKLWQVDNPDTAPDCATFVNLLNSTGSSCNFTVDNIGYQYTAGTGGTYCITATKDSTSYNASENSPASKGGCTGHDVGGIQMVTNLVLNPSFETNTTGYSSLYGQGGSGSASRVTVSPRYGNYISRMTWNNPPTSVTTNGLWSSMNTTVSGAGGKTYTASGYIRNSWASGIFSLNLVGYTTGNGSVTGETYGSNVTIPANTWTRVSVTWTAPANTEAFTLRIRQAGGSLPSSGSLLEVDGFMLTQGSTLYTYADGTSQNWAWNGTAHASTSTGPVP
jgi:prepilin-type N-terminal cleavage/methylation domain-containing protein